MAVADCEDRHRHDRNYGGVEDEHCPRANGEAVYIEEPVPVDPEEIYRNGTNLAELLRKSLLSEPLIPGNTKPESMARQQKALIRSQTIRFAANIRGPRLKLPLFRLKDNARTRSTSTMPVNSNPTAS